MKNKRGFKRQETKYAHYFYDEYDPPILLLGVNKSYSKEQAEIFIGSYKCYDKAIILRLNHLNFETREIILNSIEEIIEDVNVKDSKTQYTFNPYNMDVVLDFILELTEKTTYDLAQDYLETLPENEKIVFYSEDPPKTILDRLEKMRIGKGATNEENRKLIKWVLEQGGFNDNILRTGEGYGEYIMRTEKQWMCI